MGVNDSWAEALASTVNRRAAAHVFFVDVLCQSEPGGRLFVSFAQPLSAPLAVLWQQQQQKINK